MADDDSTVTDGGVLFVHGIGEQEPGRTLITCVDAVFSCLGDHQGITNLRLTDVDLAPSIGPPRALLQFRVKGEVEDRSYWLTESCWARSFLPLSTLQVVRWTTQVLPWAVMAYCANGIRVAAQEWRRRATVLARAVAMCRVAAAYLVFIVAPIASLAIGVLLLVCAVVALVPVPAFRAVAHWLLRLTVATLGDSLILRASRTNEAAILSRVTGDLKWVASRAATTSVVAHSQGAVLAHKVVANRPEGSLVSSLITYGSGLRPLRVLTGADDLEGSVGFAWVITIAYMVSVVTLAFLLWPLALPSWLPDLESLLVIQLLFLVSAIAFWALVPRLAVGTPRRRLAWTILAAAIPAFVASFGFIRFWLLSPPGWPREGPAIFCLCAAALLVWALVLVTRRGTPTVRGTTVLIALAAWFVALGVALQAILPQRWILADTAIITLCSLVGIVWVGALLAKVDMVDNASIQAVTDKGHEWRDFYATCDPVAGGAIHQLGDASRAVTNRGSMIRDHTAYWCNRDEFVLLVCQLLFPHDGVPRDDALMNWVSD